MGVSRGVGGLEDQEGEWGKVWIREVGSRRKCGWGEETSFTIY